MSNAIGTPPVAPISWEVFQRSERDRKYLGVVTARLWFDAREQAAKLFGVERDDLLIEPSGATK